MDVNYTEADRVITPKVPSDYYDICTLLRDPNHYVIESVIEMPRVDCICCINQQAPTTLQEICGQR